MIRKFNETTIKNIVTDPSDIAIVSSIHSIAKIMNIKTIAEFVENDDILEVLATIGINYAQGYGIGKPEICDRTYSQS